MKERVKNNVGLTLVRGTLVWPSCHQLLCSDKAWFKGWIVFRTLLRGTDLNYHKAYSLKCLPPRQFETVWMKPGIPGGFACLWRQDMSLRSHRNPWPAYNLPSLCTRAFLCCFPFICKGILGICWLPSHSLKACKAHRQVVIHKYSNLWPCNLDLCDWTKCLMQCRSCSIESPEEIRDSSQWSADPACAIS